MSIFDIDYAKLVRYVLPVRLRGSKMTAFLLALAAPVIYLYNLFRQNRDINLYALNHNSQVAYLEAALNDVFDNSLRRISIADGNYLDPVYTYLDAELKPVYLYTDAEAQPASLYTDAEIATIHYAFVVQVPAGISHDAYRLNALVDKYRLPGMVNYQVMAV